ncbi:hypothetical protein TanjilG_28447 [Lupinus angustifolius]|uniref:Rho-GAP domain-containing protein n=1 Tax=Lupinus angustifolius TaxID=3871 RepID=A0A1J7G885_LUPAN|nr:hypothetical protein TanjilG_28447 [Lupinus angustifolius]
MTNTNAELSQSAIPQKGNEVNLTLGGIDLNNSGSVVVKADKKLLTVQFPDAHDGRAFTLKAETTEDLYEWKTALENALAKAPSAANATEQNVRPLCVVVKADKKLLTVQFPDAHDGRAFTLKAETTEDLYEWKTALENALAKAPSAANATEQNGIFRNEQIDSIDISMDQLKDREPMKSTVIGRPILLALEDVDGTPSFLEKALQFLEQHGANVEGILRQAADVDDVERRVREYEQGKVEFSPDEDAHVIGDCIKHVLRLLPSSPVPASCCKALLEAVRTERGSRVSAMRTAINDTFPEPNRHLLQRILLMMQTIASRKAVNRMSSSAVAACMAPLLLRPLLAGDCDIENDFDVGGDGSIQLLQAAAAANHAQAICITLLEEYNSIFGEGSESPDIYTDTEESGSESEEGTEDDLSYDDEDYDDEEDGSVHESDVDDDLVSESYSETGESQAYDEHDDKDHDHSSPSSRSSGASEEFRVTRPSKSFRGSQPQHQNIKSSKNLTSPTKNACTDQSNEPADIVGGVSTDQSTEDNSDFPSPSLCIKKSITMSNGGAPSPTPRRRTMLGRTSARKNLSMESIDFPIDDEDEIERLETARTELQTQIAQEVEANVKLQSHIDKRKKDLQERRLALEQDVARLQEQLRKEKKSRTKSHLDELALVEVDLTDLERKVEELGTRLNAQLEQNSGSTLDSYNQSEQISSDERKWKNKADTEVSATSQSDRSISKGTNLGGAENENERKSESIPFSNKQPPTSSKKSGSKGEGANSTPSALTKLTSRLNFLKVRQSSDKGRDRDSISHNLEKGKGSETQYAANQEKGRGLDSSHSSKEKSHQSSEKLRKSDSQPGYHSEGWNPNQHPTHLERGRSEGHHQSYNVDKGR